MRTISVYEVTIINGEETNKTVIGTITVDDYNIVIDNSALEKLPSIEVGQTIESEEIFVERN